jgi:hypothetical protein
MSSAPDTQEAGGIRLTDDELTFLTYSLGTDRLHGIGVREPISAAAASVAAQSLLARGLMHATPDDPFAAAPGLMMAFAPLLAEGPRVTVWMSDPDQGSLIMVRTPYLQRATVIAHLASEGAWYLSLLAVADAAAGMQIEFDRGLVASGPSVTPLEFGCVWTGFAGEQKGEIQCWAHTADGSAVRIESGESVDAEVTPTTTEALSTQFAQMLAPVVVASLAHRATGT